MLRLLRHLWRHEVVTRLLLLVAMRQCGCHLRHSLFADPEWLGESLRLQCLNWWQLESVAQ